METAQKTKITVEATINAPVEKVWRFWTEPKHIVNWNNASDDWHSPSAKNDLKVGGKFNIRMEAKDGSAGFDFEGINDVVEPNKRIVYTLADGRKVDIVFDAKGDQTTVTETFETEQAHSIELQRDGWQAIMDNFKNYVEASSAMTKLHEEILIDAPVEKVYRLMIDDRTYREWTAEFNPSSYFEGSWDNGSKILFIGSDDKGETGGMVARINENIPNQFISIEHVGIYKNGQEITTGKEIESWAGALENYTFSTVDGKTLLSVDVDTNQEYKDYFAETWPKALNKLKEICES